MVQTKVGHSTLGRVCLCARASVCVWCLVCGVCVCVYEYDHFPSKYYTFCTKMAGFFCISSLHTEQCEQYKGYRYPTLTPNNECLPPYSSDTEEIRDLVTIWKPTGNTTSDSRDAYHYRGTPSSDFWGILATYSSSGYTQSFGHSDKKADAAFTELFETRLVRLLGAWHTSMVSCQIGPYLPCVSMVGRALLSGYHRPLKG